MCSPQIPICRRGPGCTVGRLNMEPRSAVDRRGDLVLWSDGATLILLALFFGLVEASVSPERPCILSHVLFQYVLCAPAQQKVANWETFEGLSMNRSLCLQSKWRISAGFSPSERLLPAGEGGRQNPVEMLELRAPHAGEVIVADCAPGPRMSRLAQTIKP